MFRLHVLQHSPPSAVDPSADFLGPAPSEALAVQVKDTEPVILEKGEHQAEGVCRRVCVANSGERFESIGNRFVLTVFGATS